MLTGRRWSIQCLLLNRQHWQPLPLATCQSLGWGEQRRLPALRHLPEGTVSEARTLRHSESACRRSRSPSTRSRLGGLGPLSRHQRATQTLLASARWHQMTYLPPTRPAPLRRGWWLFNRGCGLWAPALGGEHEHESPTLGQICIPDILIIVVQEWGTVMIKRYW